jgi:hypothetical protein
VQGNESLECLLHLQPHWVHTWGTIWNENNLVRFQVPMAVSMKIASRLLRHYAV